VPAVPGATKRVWNFCATPITMTSPGYCIIGYFPEGPTYYDYAVVTPAAAPFVNYFADALSNIDGDANNNIWGIQVPTTAGAVTGATAGALGCGGVLNEFGATGLLSQVGPCGVGFGTTIF